jgi:hypothetical protein
LPTAKAEETTAQQLAQELLRTKIPGAQPKSQFSAISALNLAFRDADQRKLLDASGAGGCFTYNSRIEHLDAAGRMSGRSCHQRLETNYYTSGASTVASSSAALGLPNYKQNGITVDNLRKEVAERFTSRFTSETLGRNSFFKALLEGKLDLNFSMGELTNLLVPKPSSIIRPIYRLAVKYPEQQEDGVRLASLSPVSSGALSRTPSQNALQPSQLVERQIVEEWPTATPVESDVSEVSRGSSGPGQYLKRKLRLSAEPFSNFRLRIERGESKTAGGLQLKLYDASGIASADLTSLLSGNSDKVTWETRLPYGRHAGVIASDGTEKQFRYAYEYSYTASMRGRLWFDPNVLPGTPIKNLSDAPVKYKIGVEMVF